MGNKDLYDFHNCQQQLAQLGLKIEFDLIDGDIIILNKDSSRLACLRNISQLVGFCIAFHVLPQNSSAE